jgi:hypothetical protein
MVNRESQERKLTTKTPGTQRKEWGIEKISQLSAI